MSYSTMRETDEINKRKKKRIRVDPARSPLNLIIKKLQEKKTEREVVEDDFVDPNQFSPLVQIMLEETKKDDLYYQLLKMMYIDDVDAEYVENHLGISTDELKNAVDKLVFLGFLKYNSEDEVELTDDGVALIMHREAQIEKIS